jgi:hypothetical protein
MDYNFPVLKYFIFKNWAAILEKSTRTKVCKFNLPL